MKYDHRVKTNGKYYAAGEEVPGTVAGEIPLPFSDDNIEFEERPKERKYTRTEISKLKTEELQNLATAEGIDKAFEKSGGELKKILINHFGL